MKTCSRCHLDKPLDQFAPSKRYGHQSFCKPCQSAYAKEYRAKHPDKVRQAFADYRDRNPEKVQAKAKADYIKNADKVKQQSKERYQQNREAKLTTNKRWREAHPERMSELKREWLLANPEAARIQQGRWRARKMGAQGSHTVAEWEAKKAVWDNRCAYCGIQLERLHKDHVMPLIRGGSDGIENILPSCGPCNRQKNDSFLYDWIQGRASTREYRRKTT